MDWILIGIVQVKEMIQQQIDYMMSPEFAENERIRYQNNLEYNRYLTHLFHCCKNCLDGIRCLQCKRIENSRKELLRIVQEFYD